MKNSTIVLLFICLVGITIITSANSLRLKEIEKKVNYIFTKELEKQKSSIVTPTPQKDVE